MIYLYAGLFVFIIIAVFLYGKDRFNAGYNKALIKQKNTEHKERKNYEDAYKNAVNMDDNSRNEWVRRFTSQDK